MGWFDPTAPITASASLRNASNEWSADADALPWLRKSKVTISYRPLSSLMTCFQMI